MNITLRRLLVLSAMIVGSAWATAAPAPLRVLLIGNSFTAPLPPVLQQFARATERPLELESHTPGGCTLARHVAEHRTQFFTNHWAFIVLQGQSQELSFPAEQIRRDTLPATQTLVEAARQAGARPLLYETWGYRDGDGKNRPGDSFPAMSQRIIEGYALLQQETKADTAPVGRAWALVRQRHPDLDLYAKDGRHPSPVGAHLAAAVIFVEITGVDPLQLPDGGLPPATARALHEAVRDSRTR